MAKSRQRQKFDRLLISKEEIRSPTTNIGDTNFCLWRLFAISKCDEHLNSIDQHIQFTSEQEKDGRIPFLDTCVSINQDGSTKISVYRKPTHSISSRPESTRNIENLSS